MQESPVRAEARHHAHPLHPEEVGVCVSVGRRWEVGSARKSTTNVKKRGRAKGEKP